ncbi:cob(I)yrinic acid a,c-diamide adenosyltransferase [Uliginosibacterium sp. sgz301328]|uniref:cob(I)yrinic acid a,c-diamide adenosyltransferase n=1 Tax=Uliginosibacterium sp. sgz301328 TaxID=3243764 RepID=UPI00359D151D
MHDTDNNDDEGSNARHATRMVRKKTIIDQRIAAAYIDRGVLVVVTGNGKGKSSSAFGMAARALGHDMRVGVVQFIKGAAATGEEAFFRRCDGVDFHVMGEGFTWDTQDRERDVAKAAEGWRCAEAMLSDDSVGLVILDELCVVLKYRYLPLETVLRTLRSRPASQHVVVTGRGAPEPLIEIADTVSEIDDIKHAFRAGVRAQKGIEF